MRFFSNSRKWTPYIFILPFIVSFLLFFLYPVISTIIMSFQEIFPGQVQFIGLSNYRKLFNPQFFTAVKNSLTYMILTIAVLIPIPMILAVLLNSVPGKKSYVLRGMLFIPALMSVVVVGTIFRLLFSSSELSLVNEFVGLFGVEPRGWIMAGSWYSMFLLVLIAIWRWTGINIVYFLSGLQQISKDLYESAEIDGAGPVQKFFNITIPLLKPTTVFVTAISIFGGLAMFEESYILWNAGSPNNSGLTIVRYIYRRGFEAADMGFGAAVGMALLFMVFIISFTFLKLTGFFKQERV
jgi:arabinosaccharide transport system permease protein